MDLLIPHSGTLIWMLIAFFSVFMILKKYAWKPILGALKLREDSIESALQAAEEAKLEMTRLRASNEQILSEAKIEREKIIKEAREIKDTIISDAKKIASSEADKIIENTRQAIKSEKESAITEMKEQAALLSVYIAEKLLQEKLSGDESQKELIDRLLRDIKMN